MASRPLKQGFLRYGLVKILGLLLYIASVHSEGTDGTVGVKFFNLSDSKVYVRKQQSLILTCGVIITNERLKGRGLIVWWKDNAVLRKSSRYRILPNGNLQFDRIVNRKKKNITDEGVYSCIFGNDKFGAMRSRGIHVQFGGVRRFEEEPSSTEGYEGGTVALACQARGGPQPDFSWTKDGLPLNLTHRHVRGGGGDLYVRNMTADDAGVYRCTTRNAFASRISRPATVTVKPMGYPQDSDATPLRVPRPTVVVKLGQPVVLPCVMDSSETLNVSWTRTDDGFIPNDAEAELLGLLRLRGARAEDQGQYRCRVAQGPAQTVVYTAVTNLKVLELPKFDVPPRSHYDKLIHDMVTHKTTSPAVLPSATVRLTCRASAPPGQAPIVSWLRNCLPIDTSSPRVQVMSGGRELVIRDARKGSRGDSGFYQCVATNAAGSVLASALVEVDEAAPDPPGGIRVEPVDTETVKVSWTYTGSTLAFSVFAQDVEAARENPDIVPLESVIPGYSPSGKYGKNFKYLETYTNYTFWVRAITAHCPSADSEHVFAQTLESVPVRSPAVWTSSPAAGQLQVSWSTLTRKQALGEIVKHQLWYRRTSKGETNVVELAAPALTHLLKDLSPGIKYFVKVMACTAVGCSTDDPPTWVPITLAERQELELVLRSVNYNTVEATWGRGGGDGSSSLVRLTWMQVGKGIGYSESRELPFSDGIFTISNLEPDSLYNVTLESVVMGEVGLKTVRTVHTPRSADPCSVVSEPRSITCGSVTSGTCVRVSWVPVTIEKAPDDCRLSYTVRYSALLFQANPPKNVSSVVPGVEVCGLLPGLAYSVGVRAEAMSPRNVTLSTWSSAQHPCTPLLHPMAPRNVTVRGRGEAGSAVVEWSMAPAVMTLDVTPHSYVVHYTHDPTLSPTAWTHFVVNFEHVGDPGQLLSAPVQGLNASDLYYFFVEAVWSVGGGQYSRVVKVDISKLNIDPPHTTAQGGGLTDPANWSLETKIGVVVGVALGVIIIVVVVIIVMFKDRWKCWKRGSGRDCRPDYSPAVSNASEVYSSGERGTTRVGYPGSDCESHELDAFLPILAPLQENQLSDAKGPGVPRVPNGGRPVKGGVLVPQPRISVLGGNVDVIARASDWPRGAPDDENDEDDEEGGGSGRGAGGDCTPPPFRESDPLLTSLDSLPPSPCLRPPSPPGDPGSGTRDRESRV